MSDATPLTGLRLLVVEDEMLVALALEEMLGDFGCVVVDVAGTLDRGLELAEALTLDGAILDINLGGEKVFPVAERLAERGVPFVFCTAYGTAALPPSFAKTPTLAKPYDENRLRSLLTVGLVGGTPGSAAAP
ncbi:MAG TPA: response regulator [Caulobacteraceae bacterium]|jgi:CheY-like chemotaxis protein|nr:response regulator [Caulobacteraceae bacterium]